MGACTPLGYTAPATWQRVLRGDTSARDWSDLAAEGHRAVRACRIEHVDACATRRGRALAITAAREAMSQADLAHVVLGERAGVFVGSTLGESAAFEEVAAGNEHDLTDYGVPSFCEGIAAAFAIGGPREALATACAAGNHAIGAAMLALRQGRVDVALAGGVEPFSRLSMVGFSRSRAMASGDCLPFDAQRTGMLLGEGAAMFVLERSDDARARGAQPLAEVCALGLSSDAYHPTAPRPGGRGMASAMRAAMANAGIWPHDVDWVNVHGTGTRASDAAEGAALREVFADSAIPLLSGSKGALGHALGASAAIEAMLCVFGLLEQVVPPTAGHKTIDPDISLACTREAAVPKRGLRVVLNNGFAFGGISSTLVMKRWQS